MCACDLGRAVSRRIRDKLGTLGICLREQVGFAGVLRAQPVSALEGRRPQSRQAPPGSHLGQTLCFLWPFPPDGSGMASGRMHPSHTLPTPPGAVVGRVGTSHILPSDEHSQGSFLLSQDSPRPHPGGTGIEDPLAVYEGVQQKLEEKEVGGGVGSEFPVLLPAPPPPAHT